MNLTIIRGRIQDDPKTFPNMSMGLTKFTIADSRKKKDGSFETTCFDCSAWREEAKAANFLRKGDIVFVEATYSTRDVEKDGKKTRYHGFNINTLAVVSKAHREGEATQTAPVQAVQPEPPDEKDPSCPWE